MMTKKEMMDKMIHVRGFEDKKTIYFCKLCEDNVLADICLMYIMYSLLNAEGD